MPALDLVQEALEGMAKEGLITYTREGNSYSVTLTHKGTELSGLTETPPQYLLPLIAFRSILGSETTRSPFLEVRRGIQC